MVYTEFSPEGFIASNQCKILRIPATVCMGKRKLPELNYLHTESIKYKNATVNINRKKNLVPFSAVNALI